MRNKRLSVQEWQAILDRQKETKQNDTEWAQSQGVSVASLRKWRMKLKQVQTPSQASLVEVPSFSGNQSLALRIILPNGIALELQPNYPFSSVAALVEHLKRL